MPPGGSLNSKMGGKRAEKPLQTLLRLFRYYKNSVGLLIFALLSIIAYSAATTATYYMMDPLVAVLEDGVSADMAKYIALLIAIAALYLIAVVTNYLLNRLMLSISARVL